jgi:hypothetical protein
LVRLPAFLDAEAKRPLQGDGIRPIEPVLLYGYELIVIKIAPPAEIFSKSYPERELYPSSAKNSEDWGKIAWSFGISETQKQRALEGFTKMVKETGGGLKVSDFFAPEGKDSGQEQTS